VALLLLALAEVCDCGLPSASSVTVIVTRLGVIVICSGYCNCNRRNVTVTSSYTLLLMLQSSVSNRVCCRAGRVELPSPSQTRDDVLEIRSRSDHSPITSGLLASVAAGSFAIARSGAPVSRCAHQFLCRTPGQNQYDGATSHTAWHWLIVALPRRSYPPLSIRIVIRFSISVYLCFTNLGPRTEARVCRKQFVKAIKNISLVLLKRSICNVHVHTLISKDFDCYLANTF